MKRAKYFLGASALVTSAAAFAGETITYTYDARGRLSKVERSGDVNEGVKVEYKLDKADNRKKIISTNPSSQSTPPPQT